MGKLFTRFQTKTAQKPYPLEVGGGGGTYLYGLYKGVLPGLKAVEYSDSHDTFIRECSTNLLLNPETYCGGGGV